MRRGTSSVTAVCGAALLALLLPGAVALAQEAAAPAPVGAPAPVAASTTARGGFWPFVQSCLCGPRIGLEANEGQPATPVEYLNFFIPLVVPIQALGRNGIPGFCASCSIPWLAYGMGPRVGMELDRRSIRTLEWFRVIPILNVYAAIVNGFEAGEGRTMSEIVAAERLEKKP